MPGISSTEIVCVLAWKYSCGASRFCNGYIKRELPNVFPEAADLITEMKLEVHSGT
jgi:hypothetical protein